MRAEATPKPAIRSVGDEKEPASDFAGGAVPILDRRAADEAPFDRGSGGPGAELNVGADCNGALA